MTAMEVDIATIPLLNGHLNGTITADGAKDMARFSSGLILPPPEIKCT
jgi:hypothetical protein